MADACKLDVIPSIGVEGNQASATDVAASRPLLLIECIIYVLPRVEPTVGAAVQRGSFIGSERLIRFSDGLFLSSLFCQAMRRDAAPHRRVGVLSVYLAAGEAGRKRKWKISAGDSSVLIPSPLRALSELDSVRKRASTPARMILRRRACSMQRDARSASLTGLHHRIEIIDRLA